MNARFASLWSGALVACACGSAPPLASTAHEPPPSTAAADYEVHEWGLVRGDVGDTQRFGAIGPPVSYAMMAVDKPVLYFHAAAPLTLSSVSVEARSGGTLIETWPLTTLGTTSRWTNVAIDPSGACDPSPLPTATQAPCAGLEGACESSALAIVRTDDAACVHVGQSTERFLFYRGRARTFTPPLRFERTGAYEVVRITNEGDAPIPGRIVRLWSDTYHVRTLAVAPPAPHESIDIHADFDGAAADHPVASDHRGADDEVVIAPASGPGRQTLIDTMREIGLTQSEADAFMRAWDAPLFGPGQPQTDVDRLSADGEPAPRESFVYFLPPAATEDVAHLELDPPPSGGVHRAIAMWSMLGASGATH